MIGYLEGYIQAITEHELLLRVGDVGYEVQCPTSLLRAARQGQRQTLYIHTYVREDCLRLYGFKTSEDKKWFLHLASVPGIGTRTALNFLGSMTVETLARALANGDWKTLTQAEGVGPKLARRLVTELRDKIPKASRATTPKQPKVLAGAPDQTRDEPGPETAPEAEAGLEAGVRQALEGLGFTAKEIEPCLSELHQRGRKDWTEETLFQAALEKLGKNL